MTQFTKENTEFIYLKKENGTKDAKLSTRKQEIYLNKCEILIL